MDSFTFFPYVKDLFLFLLVVVFGWYLPGRYALEKLHLSLETPEPFSIPIVTGILVFTLIAYILSWLHIVWLLLTFCFLMDYLVITHHHIPFSVARSHRQSLIIILLLAFLFSLPMITTGIFGTTAIYRVDDVLHLAYMNEIFHHFPPDNPGFAGVPLMGYHFFYDLVLATIRSLTGIRPEYLYFHFIPVLTAILWSTCTYSLVYVWRKRRDTALWATFLVLFGGSFGFYLRLQGHLNATLGSTFGINQPASGLLNPPFSFSVPLLLAGLFFAHQYFTSKKIGWVWLLGFTAGLTPVFKIYVGMLLASGLLFLAFIEGLQRRYTVLFIGICSVLLVAVTYGVFAGKGGSLLFFPLWEPHKIFVDSMPWYGYEEKIATFSKYGMWWRIVSVELYGIWLYIVGNLGSRILGILLLMLHWFRKKTWPSRFEWLLLFLLCISLVIPLLFIQTIKVFEIIQLSWYGMTIGALLASEGIIRLISGIPTRFAKAIVMAGLIGITLPSAYENFVDNVYPGTHRIHTNVATDSYFQTLHYLSHDPNYFATAIELPDKNTPPTWRNIMAWYRASLPYFPAFGNKRAFFESQDIDFPNVKVEPHINRIAELLTIETIPFHEATLSAALQTLSSHLQADQIGYIISPFPLLKVIHLSTIHEVYSREPFHLYQVK